MKKNKLDKTIEISHTIQRLEELRDSLFQNNKSLNSEKWVSIEINKLHTDIPNKTFNKLVLLIDNEIKFYKNKL
jgi:L-cysteine desulfidase